MIQFNNYSRFVRHERGMDIFEWCVFVDGDEELMRSIQKVQYVLHPTFPNPTRETTDAAHSFPVLSSGWGTFDLDILVFFKNGETEPADYPLKLEENDWPSGPRLTDFESPAERAVYDTLFDPKWQWRKTATICKLSGQSEESAERTLSSLADRGYVRKAFFRSTDNQELWGATCVLGKLPTPVKRAS